MLDSLLAVTLFCGTCFTNGVPLGEPGCIRGGGNKFNLILLLLILFAANGPACRGSLASAKRTAHANNQMKIREYITMELDFS